MTELVNILKTETEGLKNQYVQKCKEWASSQFQNIADRKSWREIDWCKFFNLEPRLVNKGTPSEFYTFPQGFFNTKTSVKYDRLRTEAYKVAKMGKEDYILKAEESAINHYENSILKLANRIEKKGLNQSNLKAVTSHIGVNIETTLTDGKKTVKAWTIIASGEVQKPHYRYLIK